MLRNLCQTPFVVDNTNLNTRQQSLVNNYNQFGANYQRAKQIADIYEQNTLKLYNIVHELFCSNVDDYRDAQVFLTDINSDFNMVKDSGVMNECLVKSIFRVDDDQYKVVGSIPIDIFINRFFTKIKLPNNYTRLQYKNLNSNEIQLNYLVKTSNEVNDFSLKLEAVIGYMLNTLRNDVPNFIYTLGVGKCSPMIASNTGREHRDNDTFTDDTDSFCSMVGDQPYVIFQDVGNYITLTDYIKSGINFNEWLNIFVQVLIALDTAQMYQFTHYDLNTDNIWLIEPYNNFYYRVHSFWPNYLFREYTTLPPNEKSYKYIRCTKLAKIVNFGMARMSFNVNNQPNPIGNSRFLYNVFPQNNFLMYDVYKLFMHSAYNALQYNQTLLPQLLPIFQFFNNGATINTFEQVIRGQKDNSYTLFTYPNEITNLSFGNFLYCLYQMHTTEIDNFISPNRYTNLMFYNYEMQNVNAWSRIVDNNYILNSAYNGINSYRKAVYLHKFLANNPTYNKYNALSIMVNGYFTSWEFRRQIPPLVNQLNNEIDSLRDQIQDDFITLQSQVLRSIYVLNQYSREYINTLRSSNRSGSDTQLINRYDTTQRNVLRNKEKITDILEWCIYVSQVIKWLQSLAQKYIDFWYAISLFTTQYPSINLTEVQDLKKKMCDFYTRSYNTILNTRDKTERYDVQGILLSLLSLYKNNSNRMQNMLSSNKYRLYLLNINMMERTIVLLDTFSQSSTRNMVCN